jgi:hypothetical protein
MKVLANVSIIVIGVVIASFGEIKFNMVGFLSEVEVGHITADQTQTEHYTDRDNSAEVNAAGHLDPRRPQEGQDDRPRLPPRYCPYRYNVQSEFDLR